MRVAAPFCRVVRPLALACAWTRLVAGQTGAVAVHCPAISKAQASEFEARARAELAVRAARGTLTLQCREEMRLVYSNGDKPALSVRVSPDSSTEALLKGLDLLLPPTPAPTSSPQTKPASAASPNKVDRSQFAAGVMASAYMPNHFSATPSIGLGVAGQWLASQASLLALGVGLNSATSAPSGYQLYTAEASLEWQQVLWSRWFASLGGGAAVLLVHSTGATPEPTQRRWFLHGCSRLGVTLGTEPKWRTGVQLRVLPRRLAVWEGNDRITTLEYFQPGLFLGLSWGAPKSAD